MLDSIGAQLDEVVELLNFGLPLGDLLGQLSFGVRLFLLVFRGHFRLGLRHGVLCGLALPAGLPLLGRNHLGLLLLLVGGGLRGILLRGGLGLFGGAVLLRELLLVLVNVGLRVGSLTLGLALLGQLLLGNRLGNCLGLLVL